MGSIMTQDEKELEFFKDYWNSIGMAYREPTQRYPMQHTVEEAWVAAIKSVTERTNEYVILQNGIYYTDRISSLENVKSLICEYKKEDTANGLVADYTFRKMTIDDYKRY